MKCNKVMLCRTKKKNWGIFCTTVIQNSIESNKFDACKFLSALNSILIYQRYISFSEKINKNRIKTETETETEMEDRPGQRKRDRTEKEIKPNCNNNKRRQNRDKWLAQTSTHNIANAKEFQFATHKHQRTKIKI